MAKEARSKRGSICRVIALDFLLLRFLFQFPRAIAITFS
jgi:hypothetical protein